VETSHDRRRTSSASVSDSSNDAFYTAVYVSLDVVLPHANDAPTHTPQSVTVATVTRTVCVDFQLPKIRKRAAPLRKSIAMPEVAVYEYSDP
jgi:hypothetical protein